MRSLFFYPPDGRREKYRNGKYAGKPFHNKRQKQRGHILRPQTLRGYLAEAAHTFYII